MGDKMLNLADIRNRPLEDLLWQVIQNREPVTVMVDKGQAVEIRPVGVNPLPELEGTMPTGWKEGICAR